ncbi:MAG: hypothetical protein AUK47_26420 [Deltaproteobacteria bacterium CG2_30_63_29]|nr:MAG: hypothetical protein AUK47_26420 [Deltaproteobacteria bacterium CG2_30_63_29]PIV98216.1 MAG: hypothetical protein COW42_15970 [Deltaproteobacteria bacterium CG17_big_fil_post_rev_8_21_14_2_50_63_7]PJB48883.1 MAG: hypothetical protein CO108_01400 [Deltaproteobacteria bacterium CG_4_9_14_3_um_filter_63_12]
MSEDFGLKNDQIIGGTYRIIEPMSAGAFGTVYLAERLEDELPVVVKALRQDAKKGDPAAVERFIREAAVASNLDHPNIVRTLNFGQSRDGVLYIVLERLKGRTLAEAMFEDAVPIDVTSEVVCQMLRGLVVAHGQGLVHRDIKPSNVFVCEPEHRSAYGEIEGDTVKLLDFGFVKVLNKDSNFAKTITMAGFIVGTPGYIAPEMLRYNKVSVLSDLYGVGVIGFELATGTQAFPGSGLERAFNQMSMDPKVPDGLDASDSRFELIAKLMARDPAQRFQSAQEALDAFEAQGS